MSKIQFYNKANSLIKDVFFDLSGFKTWTPRFYPSSAKAKISWGETNRMSLWFYCIESSKAWARALEPNLRPMPAKPKFCFHVERIKFTSDTDLFKTFFWKKKQLGGDSKQINPELEKHVDRFMFREQFLWQQIDQFFKHFVKEKFYRSKI